MSINRCLLDTILEPGALTVAFQPIMETMGDRWQLYALECLVRGPKGTNLESPDVLFDYARRKRAEDLVDRACIVAALAEASVFGGSSRIRVNVHASTLGRDTKFVEFLEEAAGCNGIPLPLLTVEIIETSPCWNGRQFLKTLDLIRGIGVQISVDDFGVGESNYNMVLDSRPDDIKLDRYLVNGCSVDIRRKAVIRSVLRLGQELDARIIAEGIEYPSDLDAVKELGIDLVQGYIFSRPMPSWELQSIALLPAVSQPALLAS